MTPEQFPKLERLAHVIERVLERNRNEVFLIEGHTDAVGSDVDNLSLSDRRAEAVAQILTEVFAIAPENLCDLGLWRAISEGLDARPRTRQPACRDPPHHSVDVGALRLVLSRGGSDPRSAAYVTLLTE